MNKYTSPTIKVRLNDTATDIIVTSEENNMMYSDTNPPPVSVTGVK